MPHYVTATKFRPQTFDELIGQEFVVASLKNSISNNRIANAYLLSGPRGVGKTSIARIIAKALNCEKGPTENPCNKCDNCISISQGSNSDVIEIDGASNTSINDIRVIQEEILYAPVSSKHKVYIIDEVHMLSKSAFNALLKTIEEPPENVVFIFATTEVNKVLPTIRSRCQQFNFRLIPVDLIYKLLINVLDSYKIKYEEQAITWIAKEGQGSMRDSYTLLDQVISFCEGEITYKKIQTKLGLVGEEKVLSLVQGIINNKRELFFTEYYSMLEFGISPEQIVIELIDFFKTILLVKSNVTNKNILGKNITLFNKELINAFTFQEVENILEILFKTYESSRFSIDVQAEVELCLIKVLNYKELIRPRQIISELNILKQALLKKESTEAVSLKEKKEANEKKDENINSIVHENSKVKKEGRNIKLQAEKSEILKIIKAKLANSHFQLFTALNNVAVVEEKENTMYLYFTHRMHYDIAKDSEDLLTQEAISIIGEKYNKDFKIRVELKNKENIESKATNSEVNIENVKNIFHGKEI
jgi:DNA polymerase-3 subunit gamma/tau